MFITLQLQPHELQPPEVSRYNIILTWQLQIAAFNGAI